MNVTELIERLRDLEYRFTNAVCDDLRVEAADALEAQAREIADLQAGWQRTYDHDVARLQERLAAAERERDPLRRFVCALFDATDWPEGGDLDQFAFQDLAEKHGILSPLEVAEPCNVGCEETKACHCAEYGEFPQTCYRMADWLIAAREGS